MAFNLRAAFAAAIGIEQVSVNKAISETALGMHREPALLVVTNQAVLTGDIPSPERPLSACLPFFYPSKNGFTARNWLSCTPVNRPAGLMSAGASSLQDGWSQ